MVNLLKDENKKIKYVRDKEKQNNKEADEKSKNQRRTEGGLMPLNKVDIKKYKDLEGITISKLELGYWVLKNQTLFYKILIGILFFISVITWSRFIWTYGYYVIFGMRQDSELARQLSDESNNPHGIVVQQAAKDIQVISLAKIKNHDGKYDLLVKLKNPNLKHWGTFDYYFSDGQKELGAGSNFIYPGEEKFIVSPGVALTNSGANLNFVIKNAYWSRITAHTIADWNVYKAERFQINTSDINFTPARSTILSEKLSLNQLEFKVQNNSAFNYHKCVFLAILYSRNNPVATSYITINNFMSGQEQNISITLPGFFGRVTDIDIYPELDIYRADNFIRFDGGVGKKK